jgi:hypothetical protein
MRPDQRGHIISIEKLFIETRSTVTSDDDSTVSIFCDFDIRNLKHGLCRRSHRSAHSGVAHTVDSEHRDGHDRPLDQSSSYTRYVPAWRARLLPFDGAIHECDRCPTFVTHRDVGWILSLEVFFIVVVGVLLLGIQLFDGRLWRRSSAAGMAELGANRKSYGRVDVWSFRGTFVRHRTQAREGKITRVG